ncbi:MAG TPA: signal peptide peptidase SppA [Candidatus Kryptonia bacterium]|nr:signal peptide peptidase SppA [Candidatus Kryptonia bacterium]
MRLHWTRLVSPLLVVMWTASLSGCVFISAAINPFGQRPEPLQEHVVSGEGKDKILLLDISHVISADEQQGTFGLQRRESTVANVEEQLQQAAKDDRVKAIVLRVDSPGGTVTASDIIYHRLMEFKDQQHLPIIAHFGDVATSGAYYVSLAADEIIASPTSVTGSIGVVMAGINVEGLMSKLGVSNQTIKSGAHKDIGSPLRKMTAEESAILQHVLDEMHARFAGLVRERRPQFAASDKVDEFTDGRIVTAGQALDAKLVDRIGYLDDAIADARGRAQLSQARVVMYRRPGDFAENIYSQSVARTDGLQVNLVNLDLGVFLPSQPGLLYLWMPGGY